MEFIIGCNYWASNAGTEMWREFDEKAIEDDIRLLSQYGVKHMRVFPNWRDFQPVIPVTGWKNLFSHFRFENGKRSDNPYYLDKTMLERFRFLLDTCEKYGVKTVVGLITGWMSGRMFVPPALFNKNIISDPEALYFEQLFIAGFVSEFKNHKAVLAWDLGNECNCMGFAKDRFESANWTATIANAIRAQDNTRPVVSGMHGIALAPDSEWTIADQGMFTDMMTTHPYLYFCQHTKIDPMLSVRSTSHATAQTKFFAELTGKPCMAEEIGNLGPMISSDFVAAKFLKLNFFSLWANSATGVMWWCANEQDKLYTAPYTENMCETELGMLDSNRNPKPVLLETKRFSEFLDSLDFELPKPRTDGVCLLTRGQRQWGVGYMSYILAAQNGLNLQFAFADNGIPESKLYVMPSVKGTSVMPKENYDILKAKVKDGATLYISLDDCTISGFEELTGLRVTDSYAHDENYTVYFGGREFAVTKHRNFILENISAKVLATDSSGNIAISESRYGKGRVIVLNFPLEDNLIDRHEAFDSGYEEIYKAFFTELSDKHFLKVDNKDVFVTLHKGENACYAVLVNHSDKPQKIGLSLSEGYEIEKAYYGDINEIPAYDACVVKVMHN